MTTRRSKRSTIDCDDENENSQDDKEIKIGMLHVSKSSLCVNGTQKIFLISKGILTDNNQQLIIEKFYHPGKGRHTYFMTKNNNIILEILQYNDPYRCWLVDDEMCSDGRIYFTTPIDTIFLALPHLRKHCSKSSINLNHIHDDDDESVNRLLNCFINPHHLKCLTDVKCLDDVNYFKYNHEKTLIWLKAKTMRLLQALKDKNVYCGHVAKSQNYINDSLGTNKVEQDNDYLRYACDYVGSYLSADLKDELTKLLNIQPVSVMKSVNNNKRKQDKITQDTNMNKKRKLSNDFKSEANSDNEDDDKQKLKDIILPPNLNVNVERLIKKKRSLNPKEVSLAKSAKGMKAISSFFIKKSN